MNALTIALIIFMSLASLNLLYILPCIGAYQTYKNASLIVRISCFVPGINWIPLFTSLGEFEIPKRY